jgi:imidazoleglycerol-phosphate dehydratase
MRKATIKRKTKETDIEVAVNLDGSGVSEVATGIGFFDHMLDLLARHSRIDITVKAVGDLHIDHHHTTEDVGIALGQAVKQALGAMAGITRYASIHMPMDETLSRVVIDISGRPVLVFKVEFPRDKVGTFDTELVARMVQRLRDQCRRDFARRDPIWREQPSYRRILLQGSGKGAAGGGRDRSARRGRSAIHQGSARRLSSKDIVFGGDDIDVRFTPFMNRRSGTADCCCAEADRIMPSFATGSISGHSCSRPVWLACAIGYGWR